MHFVANVTNNTKVKKFENRPTLMEVFKECVVAQFCYSLRSLQIPSNC